MVHLSEVLTAIPHIVALIFPELFVMKKNRDFHPMVESVKITQQSQAKDLEDDTPARGELPNQNQ